MFLLDPQIRIKVGSYAKWAFTAGVLGLLWSLPILFRVGKDSSTASEFAFQLSTVIVTVVMVAFIVTGVRTLIAGRQIVPWREPITILRDWLLVGISTSLFYSIAVFAIHSTLQAEKLDEWFRFRAPVLFVAAIGSLFLSRRFALNRSAVFAGERDQIMLAVAIQALATVVAFQPLQSILYLWSYNAGFRLPLLVISILAITTTIGVLYWGWWSDRRRLRARENIIGQPPIINIVIVGGPKSGKTAFILGAYHEWSTAGVNDFQIRPTKNIDPSVENLETLSQDLYYSLKWPSGDSASQDLSFDLIHEGEPRVRFNLLDYTGEAILRNADPIETQTFWTHVDSADAIILIVDGPAARREKQQDDLAILGAYQQVMERVSERNGRTRAVPLALIMTKCDEFTDRTGEFTGKSNLLQEILQQWGGYRLEEIWRSINRKKGIPFVEFSHWYTSAVTRSSPERGEDGELDYSQGFKLNPLRPPKPTACVTPLLWITCKSIYWNAPLFHNLRSFIFGNSVGEELFQNALWELNQHVDQLAAHRDRNMR